MCNRSIVAAVAALLMSGCAIHPVPEDVTGVPTAGIVKQIRCETRDAARAAILRELDRLAAAGDAISQDLAARYHENEDRMTAFDAHRSFAGPQYARVRDVFDVIYSAAIAYNFDLTMSEDNNFGGSVNFLGPWTGAKVTLGLIPDFNRTRKNERTFTITDKFSYLLTTLNTEKSGEHYCDGHITVGPNYVYPIVGRIGVWNTVYTFFQMSFFDNLAPDKSKPGVGGTPAMADILTFTTMVDLQATPKVMFSPVLSGFQVTDSSLTGTLRRQDIHQVTLAVALDSNGTAPLSSIRGFVFSSERGAGAAATRAPVERRVAGSQLLVLNRVTAATTTPAEQLAVYMIDQLKSRELQLIPPASP